MSDMINAIYEQVERRQRRAPASVTDHFPSVYTLEEDTILGSFAWSGMHSKKRLLQYATAYRLGDYWTTPAELARDYLSIKMKGRRLRATKSQRDLISQRRHHPLFAIPCYLPDGIYIDVRSAYWTLTQIFGFNVEYYPGHFLGKGDSMEDFPFPGLKLARNCLVSSGLVSPARCWSVSRQTLFEKHTGRPLINYGLWAAVQDTLNAVALEMIQKAGAVYVHTDGYIIDRGDLQTALELLAGWGLVGRVKAEGGLRVYGPGSYAVGTLPKRKVYHFEPFINITSYVDREWLKPRVSKLAMQTDLFYE